MEKFVSGDVVVVPFSNLSDTKKRPALILSVLDGSDVIIVQITSQIKFQKYTIDINNIDFKDGGLDVVSYARCDRLYTLDSNIILYKIGSLKKYKFKEVQNRVVEIITC